MTNNKATDRAWHDWMHNPVKVMKGDFNGSWDHYEFNARRCNSATGPAVELNFIHAWMKFGAKRPGRHVMYPALTIADATKLRDKLTAAIDACA